MALVGAFAVFHGHAHGAEMPVAASGLAYGLGFLLATALLHGAGLALGFGLDKAAGAASHKLARAGGAFIGLSGLAILRSEEHTSELQSLMRISYAVFCLKKKTKTDIHLTIL